MSTEIVPLTMSEFIRFLQKYCKENIKTDSISLSDIDKNLAYEDIQAFIKVFLEQYAEQKKLTKKGEEDFLKAIQADERKPFTDPIELIRHIREIASRPPFFDSERVSLAAINGFCGDFLHEDKQERIRTATF